MILTLFGFDFGEPFILGLYVNQTNINFICLFSKLQEEYVWYRVQSTRYRVQGTGYRVLSTKYWVKGIKLNNFDTLKSVKICLIRQICVQFCFLFPQKCKTCARKRAQKPHPNPLRKRGSCTLNIHWK